MGGRGGEAVNMGAHIKGPRGSVSIVLSWIFLGFPSLTFFAAVFFVFLRQGRLLFSVFL